MVFSIVIVNYNVKYFLEQCLESVFASDMDCGVGRVELEVYVVDNASVDGSVEMVRERFPQVHLIANTDNPGFAKANNQALQECKGDLMLLLNPDTVVERDTFRQCIDFFASHPDCGGLGVKMINGEGRYLRESKRGFPTPEAAFYKMSGLIRLFPRSRRVAAYYMGHIGDDEVAKIDVLPGAYLMFSRAVYDKVGLLDESYFMYGEDIDFSWRIKLAGFENYYLPTARIIHYKGESTKHGSMNYVYTFYNAMSIFVQRYFSGSGAWLFNMLLRVAIWARATVAWLRRIIQGLALPLCDFVVAYAGFVGLKWLWSAYWAENVNYYPAEYTTVVIPLYILVLMASSWLYGGYVKPVRIARILRGMLVGSAALLLFYSLLDESQRYSRALLIAGCAWTLTSTGGIRCLLSALRVPGYSVGATRHRVCLIVGGEEEVSRVRQLYGSLADAGTELLSDSGDDIVHLGEMIRYYKVDEVVFCGKDLSTRQIIDLMTGLAQQPHHRWQVEYKTVPTDSDFIIGNGSTDSAEDLYAEELNTVASPLNRRNKRLFDVVSSVLLMILSPLLIWMQHDKRHYYAHCWQVLRGRKSWVGTGGKGIFGPEDALRSHGTNVSPEALQRLHLRYQRNYRLTADMQILLRNLFRV